MNPDGGRLGKHLRPPDVDCLVEEDIRHPDGVSCCCWKEDIRKPCGINAFLVCLIQFQVNAGVLRL